MNIARVTEVIRNHYDEYAEFGTTYHGEFIIIADWNKVPYKLESYCYTNFEIGYSDDTISDENGLYHRTNEQTYLIWDCSVVSVDDFDSDTLVEYIDACLRDNPRAALSIPKLIDMLPEIATKISDGHENGLHEHMTDDPVSIMKNHPDYAKGSLFFAISAMTPFMVEFELWQLNDEDND